MCVNFLLYVVLIFVYYLVDTYYLQDGQPQAPAGYQRVGKDAEDKPSTGLDLEEDAGSGNVFLEEEGGEEEEDDAGIHKGVELAEEEPLVGDEAPVIAQPPLRRRSTSSRSFLDFNNWEDVGTKQEVLQRLAICALGLNFTFLAWGVLQERMLTKPYDGEYFTYSYGLVCSNRLGGLLLSWALLWYAGLSWPRTNLHEFSFPSVSNMLSSWCQYEALKYVTFPTSMLSKSFKILPIMLMGKFLGNKTYEAYEYGVAGMIAFGISLFVSSSEGVNFGRNAEGEAEGTQGTIVGVVLLLLYLLFDSFTGQWQTRMFTVNRETTPVQMMAITSAFSTVFSFITLVHTRELSPAVDFVVRHPLIRWHLLAFSVLSTIGQLFIFYTIKNFGAVVFAIIMTVRILLSIVLSCVIYSHPITELGVLGMLIVFCSIAYRINKKTAGTRLLHWQHLELDQGRELLAMWHEHVDS
eukprot:CAMPEP_0198437438 /NCGR_PEP_ID=MMETSP1452-20131203/46932_1 /TAXON_ID=1181717 /ORGANISM="Synchroma pusillum, Strain CCMP3072" /LENGTH=464 /DNA_ID=CAMNT_0044158007 /DNA_START=16 /DNA_END=1410 /DNA_ORIENTATION=+